MSLNHASYSAPRVKSENILNPPQDIYKVQPIQKHKKIDTLQKKVIQFQVHKNLLDVTMEVACYNITWRGPSCVQSQVSEAFAPPSLSPPVLCLRPFTRGYHYI